MAIVHHTEGLRQQLGKAKLHAKEDCPSLVRGTGHFAEEIDDDAITERMKCRRCWPKNEP